MQERLNKQKAIGNRGPAQQPTTTCSSQLGADEGWP